MLNTDLAIARWALTDLKPIYQHPSKAVFTAESETFGPVILKYDGDHARLASEYHMLARLQGNHCCKVYDFDEEQGLLLEERIRPGTVLREVTSPEARIEAFCQVFAAIHTSGVSDKLALGQHATYLDWLRKIRTFCETHPVEDHLRDMTIRAYEFCAYLFEKYEDRALLHGDLHHDNLLLRGDGSYAMIDPKGVIGPAILDLPRFLLNELYPTMPPEPIAHMEMVIRLISQQCGYPPEDVQKAFYMETVLANMWSVQDDDPANWQELEVADHFGGM